MTTPASDVDGSGGGITWDYTVAASAVEYLAAGQTKLESFTFTLSDGQGGTVDRTVDVTITGTNDGPIVAATDVTGAVTSSAPERQSTDSGTIAFSDVDLADTHSVGPVTPSAGALGSLTASVDDAGQRRGRQRWRDHVGLHRRGLGRGIPGGGPDQARDVHVHADDGQGGTVDRTVDVTITGTNDGPIVAATDVTGAVTKLGTPSGNLTDSGTIAFSDVDLADTHSVGPVTPSAGALGSLTASVTTPASDVDGSGGGITWNYTVAASAVEYLATGQTKLESFTFTLSDGQGGTVDRTVDVTITGTNDGPIVAATDVTGAVTELAPRAAI